MTQWLLHLPTWWMIRISGLASYTLLFAGVALGILYSMPVSKRDKAVIYRWHSFSANAGLLLGVTHALLLMIDKYLPFAWKEMTLPFSAAKDPVWNGLGTLALYGMLVVLVTTDFRTWLPAKVWRALHLLSYPVFLMALAHGIGAGTDSAEPWIFGWYAVTCVMIIVLTALRVWIGVKHAGGTRKNAHLVDGR